MELMGAFENRQSGPVVAQNIERCPEKVEGVEEVRLHSNGLFERLAGFRVALEAEIAEAQIVPCVEGAGIQFHGPLERLNGLCVMGMVAVKLAKQHQLLGVVRISRVPAGFRDLSRG